MVVCVPADMCTCAYESFLACPHSNVYRHPHHPQPPLPTQEYLTGQGPIEQYVVVYLSFTCGWVDGIYLPSLLTHLCVDSTTTNRVLEGHLNPFGDGQGYF